MVIRKLEIDVVVCVIGFGGQKIEFRAFLYEGCEEDFRIYGVEPASVGCEGFR